jgi:hypothetical protein
MWIDDPNNPIHWNLLVSQMPSGLSVAQMRDLQDVYVGRAWEAYAPVDRLMALANKTTMVRSRDAGEDMRAWLSAYQTRTEPTWNECRISETFADGNMFSVNRHGFAHLAAVDGTHSLIESSDYPENQPGWYAVRPNIGSPGHVPHVIVNRVYPEGDPRALIYFRRTYQHPSREYALEVARQLMTRDTFTYLWRNTPLREMSKFNDYTWWLADPDNISYVEVSRIPARPNQSSEDLTWVTRDYLRERGQWADDVDF